MRKINTAEELHSLLYNIASVFHTICVNNNIPYYMLGGTMLGAIRHKSIIPWDDDMDFGVPRRYFERLKKLLLKQLPSYYCVRDMENCTYIESPVFKIDDLRTEVIEFGMEKSKSRIGVFIDVFPLDDTNKYKFFSRNSFIQNLTRIDQYRNYCQRESMRLEKKCLAMLIKLIFLPFPRLYFTKVANYLAMNGSGDYCANHFGFWRMKEIVPWGVMGKPTLYKIGSLKLYGVEHYDMYLNSLYKDYMKLPPENKRHMHLVSISYKDEK